VDAKIEMFWADVGRSGVARKVILRRHQITRFSMNVFTIPAYSVLLANITLSIHKGKSIIVASTEA
jgi:hypothetical protein